MKHLHALNSKSDRSFTLIELLVVMGIIAILGALTAVGYRGVAQDAKLSTGKNTIKAVLDNARGLAMKNNRIVLVVFRPRLQGTKEQYIEAVFCKWAESSARNVTGYTSPQVIDRVEPMEGVPTRALPRGIKIAGPYYSGSFATNTDNVWITLSHLPNINQGNGVGEIGGEMIGVMYAPDGTTVTRNSATDTNRLWIDFDGDGLQRIAGTMVNYYQVPQPGPIQQTMFDGGYFEQKLEVDEPYIDVVPFLAVFDDDDVREQYDVNKWNPQFDANAFTNRQNDYSAYINAYADRIHFNRYTGVAMK